MDTTIQKASKIRGTLRVPGDKSIAHRALILGAAARGKQVIEGIPRSGDVASTIACLQTLGCFVEEMPDGRVLILSKEWIDKQTLDAGNSATGARLLSGLVVGKRLDCTIDGDSSLRRRPMVRIAEPLERMGARVQMTDGNHLPMRIQGGRLTGITCESPVPSAQIKSTLLIAGLHAEGTTTVVEKTQSRNHTENLLEAMGVAVKRNGDRVSVRGGTQPKGIRVTVPGDISSGMFFIVAAACLPDSEVVLTNTGINPTRLGAVDVLEEMGANITIENVETHAGEPAADIIIRPSALRGVTIGEDRIPGLIDELPILAVAATQAEGVTTVRGARELRYKESDRIRATVRNLSLLGADITELEDGFIVKGPSRLMGRAVSSDGDHRIAMAMSIAGLFADGSTKIENSAVVGVSYPDFFRDLRALVR